MESKNKNGVDKTKRSKRRLLTKSDNYINSNETNKIIDKLTLKTRGPYVVRNHNKLVSNDLPDDKGRKETKSQEQNQRKFSSTVITSSLIGNRKFIAHQIVKSKRRNKNSLVKQETMKDPSVINNEKNSKNCKGKSQNHKQYKEENDVIYVLPTRNNYQSVTNTNSVVSKQIEDSRSTLYNKDVLNEGSSGVDRIADEVLEGWMKRKEKKLKGSQHSNIAKEKDEVLFNLCIDLDENTKSDYKIEQNCSTCSKYIDKYQKMIQPAISGKTLENIYDFDINDQENEISNKFFITQNEDENLNYTQKKIKYRKPRIPYKKNLKTQSLIQPKFTKHDNTTKSHKEIRRNSKKEFLNIIKRELQMPTETYQEPRNMFDALTVLAKNRNKTKTGISFEDTVSKTKLPKDSDCQYDNSKLIHSFKRYKYQPKTKLFNHGQQIHRGSKTKKKLMPSLEVKHFHKSPDTRLRVITI